MATYTQQCTKVGSFSYAGNFTLYVVLNDRDGNPSTNKSQVDYNVYCQSSGSGSISARHRRYFSLNGSTIIDTTETINASSPNAYIPIASGTMEIPHNPDGSKTISFSAIIQGATYGVSASISGDFTLNTIPRASSISCSTANIEENAVITISSASNSFTHTVIAYFGNETVTVATGKSGGSFQWTIPSSFYAQIPNSKTGVGTIRCHTYNGGTLIGTKDAILNVSTSEARCKPDIWGAVEDTNETTINLTGNRYVLIKNKSTAKATIATNSKNSAWITKKIINGVTINENELWFPNVIATSFNFETVDSRGYSNSTTVTPQMIDYIPLTVNANFFRPQPTTGEVQLKYSGNYFNGSFGATSNSLSIIWQWKKHGDNDWIYGGTITPTISGNKIVDATVSLGTDFDYQTAYDFQIIATDKLTTFTQTATVSVGMPVFYWGKDFMTVDGRLKANTYFLGVKNPACWAYIGEIELGSQGSYAVLDCYMGDGQNGRAEQNTHARILLKQGWTGGTLPIGITTRYTQNYKSSIKVKISHTSLTKCKLYMYLPFSYNDLTYTINGSYNSFTPSNTILSEEPTTDKESTYYKDFEPVSLFDNPSGTTGTVQLSESAANFTYLEFFICDNKGNNHKSVRAYNPNGKNVSLGIDEGYLENNLVRTTFRTERVSVSGTSVTIYNDSYSYLSFDENGGAYHTHENYIKITKIIGYR